MKASGDVTINGTLNSVIGSGASVGFEGGTFTNNGIVTGNVSVNMGPDFGSPLTQNLGGTGSWAGSLGLLINSLSTTTLLNDFNYDGGSLFVVGRLITGLSTLDMPCTVTWSSLGLGDVIGNVRRTNLGACPGAAVAFGNPFTTIQFTSGTPPDEIAFNIALEAPAGIAGAVAVGRTYLITPFGGSGYTATLRLHYLDAELNGSTESTLQLMRYDGSVWSPQGASNRNTTDNWVEDSGVTQFSPWAIVGSLPPPPPPPPPPLPPNAPTDLTATAASTTQINLAWTDNSNNEGGFKIERCDKRKNCTNFVEIAQVGADVTAFSSTGLAKNTPYRYRVRAFNASGNSPYSNIAAAKTPRI